MTMATLDFRIEQRNIDRAGSIRTAAKRPDAYVKQRIAESAAELDRTGLLQSHLDLCIEAMAALISILYNADADGQPGNVDRVTGKIGCPVPWSDDGAKRWGLRQWEGRNLRKILRNRVGEQRRFPPLFDYSEVSNRWYVDLHSYPTLESALAWLKREAPSLAEWRTVVNEQRQAAAERVATKRMK